MLKGLDKQYIAGGHDAATMAMRAVLPPSISQLDAEFGLDVWDRMMRDSAVGGAVDTLIESILDDGVRPMPAVTIAGIRKPTPEQESDAALALELSDFVKRCFDNIGLEGVAETTFQDLCEELLDAMAYGFRVAEIGYEVKDGLLLPKQARPKPNKNVRFVVDRFTNVVGVVGVRVGENGAIEQVPSGYTWDQIEKALVPPSQVLVYSHRPKNGDPRGRSVLERPYNPWYMKTVVLPEWFRYLRQFGTPLTIGETAPDGGGTEELQDKEGNLTGETLTPQQAMARHLQQFLNASYMVVPSGAKIHIHQATGSGEAFERAINALDVQIAIGIHGTSRSLKEAQHGSKADAGAAQDVVGLRTRRAKREFGEVLTRFSRLLVSLNYGADAVRLAPVVTLSSVEQQDRAAMLQAHSQAFASGYIHESQLPELHRQDGLPEADYEAMSLEKEEEAERARLAAGELGKMVNPGDPLEDDEEE